MAVILVARFSKLHHLFAERSQLRLAIFLTSCVVVLVLLAIIGVITIWRLSRLGKEEAAKEARLKPAVQEIRARVIAAGLATPENVDHYIRGLRQPEFKALMEEYPGLRRTHFR